MVVCFCVCRVYVMEGVCVFACRFHTCSNIVPVLRSQAEHHGFLLLAPQSSAYTWDTIASVCSGVHS